MLNIAGSLQSLFFRGFFCFPSNTAGSIIVIWEKASGGSGGRGGEIHPLNTALSKLSDKVKIVNSRKFVVEHDFV